MNADIVHAWFRDCLACGAIARNTPAYNQAFSALPDLIRRLDASSVDRTVAAAPPPSPAPVPEASGAFAPPTAGHPAV